VTVESERERGERKQRKKNELVVVWLSYDFYNIEILSGVKRNGGYETVVFTRK